MLRRIVVIGKRDEAAARTEIKTELPPAMPILATHFDNLKDGLPAIIRAVGSPKEKPAAVGAEAVGVATAPEPGTKPN